MLFWGVFCSIPPTEVFILCQYHAGFVSIAQYYNLKACILMPSASPFLFKVALAVPGLF